MSELKNKICNDIEEKISDKKRKIQERISELEWGQDRSDFSVIEKDPEWKHLTDDAKKLRQDSSRYGCR